MICVLIDVHVGDLVAAVAAQAAVAGAARPPRPTQVRSAQVQPRRTTAGSGVVVSLRGARQGGGGPPAAHHESAPAGAGQWAARPARGWGRPHHAPAPVKIGSHPRLKYERKQGHHGEFFD
jgi:hypothetical protein